MHRGLWFRDTFAESSSTIQFSLSPQKEPRPQPPPQPLATAQLPPSLCVCVFWRCRRDGVTRCVACASAFSLSATCPRLRVPAPPSFSWPNNVPSVERPGSVLLFTVDGPWDCHVVVFTPRPSHVPGPHPDRWGVLIPSKGKILPPTVSPGPGPPPRPGLAPRWPPSVAL